MKTQYLIVPAWTDQAGQCRIVARDHEQAHPNALAHYREHGSQWKDVGIMSSDGRLVCLDAAPDVHQEFRDCEPLAAGMTLTVDALEKSKQAPAVEDRAVLIVHPEMGVYLGGCMGLGFWSKLDPAGQDAAVCFDSEADALAHAQSWDGGCPQGLSFVAVTPDVQEPGAKYASISACVQAGLQSWESQIPAPPGERLH